MMEEPGIRFSGNNGFAFADAIHKPGKSGRPSGWKATVPGSRIEIEF